MRVVLLLVVVGAVLAQVARAAGSGDETGLGRKLVPPTHPPCFECIRDCPECPQMVVVPAGSFIMGDDHAPIIAFPGKRYEFQVRSDPAHRVTIGRPFAIGRFEVTHGEYKACVAEGGCRPNDYMAERNMADRFPVIYLYHRDIVAFTAWLSTRTGQVYRLPSEAEWEYAARGGTSTKFWWGDEMRFGLENCVHCQPPDVSRGLLWVGWFRPNPFGLYDMIGNASEVAADCWNDTYVGAPADGTAWREGDCTSAPARGGSWYGPLRSYPVYRRYQGGSFGGRSSYSGFRVVRDLADEEIEKYGPTVLSE